MKVTRTRTEEEQAAGRLRTWRTMAEGLVDQIRKDYKLPHTVVLDGDSDWRNWKVRVFFDIEGSQHIVEEPFMEFPSDELKTTLMLLRGS